ncbi:MAG: type I phosphomannose isomerase catalytic subunit [Acidimicrobiia bacterium]
MLPDVLRLEPLMVERPWGGRRLESLGRSLPPTGHVGESWEVADLPPADGSAEGRGTQVADGPLAGATLSDLITRFGAGFLGSADPTPDGRFPLLVKLLDAREHLSVQVHPPTEIADQDPRIRPKTESWYVIAAEPGSKLWFDMRTDVDIEDLRAAAGTAGFVDLLEEVPARVGDFHHIPAGRVHALGAGVVVLEIQTPSDTTFRIYDWNEQYARPPRELHLAAALRSIVRSDPAAISVGTQEVAGTRELVHTADYWIREHRVDRGCVTLDERKELRVLMVLRGELTADSASIGTGDIRILPASSPLIGTWDAAPGTVLVETGLR